MTLTIRQTVQRARTQNPDVENLVQAVQASTTLCHGWKPSDLLRKVTGTYISAWQGPVLVGLCIVEIMAYKRHKRVTRIKLLCGDSVVKGIGSILMQHIQAFASAHKSSLLVTNSVPEAVGFYNKIGFVPELDEPCASGQLCAMQMPVRGRKSSKSKSKVSFLKSRSKPKSRRGSNTHPRRRRD